MKKILIILILIFGIIVKPLFAENEKLSVIEEVENWFRVSTGDGTGGWLPKTSVKKTE